jgi:hypothetical protein
MTDKIDDGGPAFPESYKGNDMPHEGVGNGLTKREWYAGMALMGLLAGDPPITHEDDVATRIATAVFATADAMIAESKK